MSYDYLDDVPWSIRQSRLRTLEASPNPSHFSLVSNTPDPPHHQEQVMSPNTAQAPRADIPHTSTTSQQQQQLSDGQIWIRSLAQVTIPEAILTRLQQLASINFESLPDADTMRVATQTLAYEISSRTENVAAAIQALAQASAGVRDGAMELERRTSRIADVQSEEQKSLQDLQRRLEVLESRGNVSDNVDPRIETLESLMQGLLGTMQDQNSGSGGNHATATDALQQSLQQYGAEVANVKAQLGQMGADVSQTTAQMKEDDRRLKSALHRIEMLEQVSEKLRGRCDQIEAAMKERDLMATSGALHEMTSQAEVGGEVPTSHPTSRPSKSSVGGTVWHQMSPDAGDTLHNADDDWYSSDWPEPTRWPQPGWQAEPPGLGPPPAVPKMALEKVHPGNWKLLKDCPTLKLTQGEPWELGLALRQWENQTSSIASAVAGTFGQFFRLRMQQALARYQRRQATSVGEPVPLIPEEEREYETRLGVMLIKNLPATIRQPVMERHQGAEHLVSTLLLLEAVMERFSPGGAAEMTSLLQFQRALPTAGTFKELLNTIRRFELAKGRSEYLKLPPIAAHEIIRSLEGLTRNLEKKHSSLAMRLNLIKLTPEVVVPSEAGVQRLLTTLVQEGRRMQAEDEVARNRRGNEVLDEDGQGATAFQAKSSGKGAKGAKGEKGPRDTSKIPCGYFQLERGCLNGDACPHLHATLKGSKGKGKGQNPGKKGTEEHAAVTTEAKAKAKAEAKAKRKAEAKAAAPAEAKMALVGSGAVAASAVAVVKSAREADADESGSELSSMGRSEPGSDAPTSSLGSPSEPASEEEIDQPPRQVVAPRLWYLVLTPAEFVYWSRPRQVICRAAREFQESTGQYDVARGLWLLFQELDFDFPIQGEQIGPGQFVMSAREVLCEHADNIIRPVVLVHILDSDTGQEQMLALANHQVSPRVRPWRQFQALLGIMRPLREAAQDLRGILDQEEAVFGSRGYAERFGNPDLDGFPPARAPTVPTPQNVVVQDAGQAVQNPGTSSTVQTGQNPGTALASQSGLRAEGVGSTGSDDDSASSREPQGGYATASMATTSGVTGQREDALVLVDSGANEVVRRYRSNISRKGTIAMRIVLASGEVVGGFRTRDGEVVLQSDSSAAESGDPESSGEWILGVMRVIEVGGAFHWTNQGATLLFPDQGFLRKVRCRVRNGLPYMTWTDFAVLRKVLSRHWKSSDGRIRVARALAKNEQADNLFISQDLLEAAEFEMHGCEMFAEVAYEHVIKEILNKRVIDKADIQKALDLAALEPTRTARAGRTLEGGKIRAWIFGGFAHGPMPGLTKATQQHPLLARLLARYFRQEVPEGQFGAVAVLDSVAFKPHRDNNAKDCPTYITTFTEYSGGDLWLEDPSGSELRVICEGKDPVAGRCVSLKDGVVQFDGSKWHGTEAFDGRRLVAVAYTPKHHRQWTDDTRERLQQLGFPVRKSQSTSVDCRSGTDDTQLQTSAPPQLTTPAQHHPHEQIPKPKEPKPGETSGSKDLEGRSGRDMGFYDSGLVSGDETSDFGETPDGIDPAAMVSAKQVMSFLAEGCEVDESEPQHASGWDQAAYEA